MFFNYEEEMIMKKEYNAPKAEKFDFNYTENVVASATGLKEGAAIDGCYKKANSDPDKNCIPQY